MITHYINIVYVQPLTVWPKPATTTNSGEIYQLSDQERNFDFKATGYVSNTLDEAFERYNGIIFRRNNMLQKARNQKVINSKIVLDEDSIINGVDVNVLTNDLSLTLETNQAYTLSIEVEYKSGKRSMVLCMDWRRSHN